MQKYHALPAADRPRVFGMTASPVNLRLSDSAEAARATIVAEIRELERIMDAKVVTIHDLTEIQMVRARRGFAAALHVQGIVHCMPHTMKYHVNASAVAVPACRVQA